MKRQKDSDIKSMHLTNEKIAELKRTLEEEQNSITTRIQNVGTGMDFGNDIDAGDEETDEAEELGNVEGIKFVLEEKLKSINNALKKIDEGSYGICETCKKEIEPELLNIAPESHLCKNCKQHPD